MIRAQKLFLLIAQLLLCLTSGLAVQTSGSASDLMPVPQNVELTGVKFRIDSSFTAVVVDNVSQRLYSGATRLLRRLSGRTGLFFAQDYLNSQKLVESPNLIVRVNRKGDLEVGEDESYSLLVSADSVKLDAETDLGALHGLETLLQLLAVDESGYYFPGVTIRDKPRFTWRGLLIDACRHFMPVAVIKRNLDAMAAVKLNVLHWHLSEDQGFRVESKVYPRLHQLGSDGFYYTQAQIKDILSYAADRGIRVVPEFDVPGHATAWLAAYPELGSAPGPYEIERNWGIFYPVLNPARELTYTFLDGLFGEMAALFPDAYFHIGGDEIEHAEGHEAKHWNENPEIQAFMIQHGLADNAALQAYFNQRVLKILTEHNKIMVGWDEILHESMPTNIVIQSWRGRDSMVQAARAGYQSLLSNGYYIDLIQSTEFHYLNDPLPDDMPLSAPEKEKILGGEATMWSEMVTAETVDSRIWPRTAAIAERLWSASNVNDVDDMYRRLAAISLQLEEHGVTHIKNYDMMLRRLTRGQEIQTLRTLVDLIEPVKIYNRGRLRPHTSYSPMTRVVDAARPDAEQARAFREVVKRYLASDGDEQLAVRIKARLELWESNHDGLSRVIARSPVLFEIESLSRDLREIARIGLRAMELLTRHELPDKGWLKQSRDAVKEAAQPRGQTELMVTTAIEKLLDATASEK